MSDQNDRDLMLGQVVGQLNAQTVLLKEVLASQRAMDQRLRKVEVRSAINGAAAGGLASVAVAAIGATLKAKIGLGG